MSSEYDEDRYVEESYEQHIEETDIKNCPHNIQKTYPCGECKEPFDFDCSLREEKAEG